MAILMWELLQKTYSIITLKQAKPRLMPLARVKVQGEEDLNLGGSLLLDLPKLGWLQAGYDSFYGAAAGIGFNLNQRLSLGYTMEKGFGNDLDNLGVTHEISFAYSFTPNLTEDRVMLEEGYEEEVADKAALTKDVASNDELEELKRKLAENDEVLAQLMFKQDSIEKNRQADLERRFNLVMKMVRKETKGQRPDLEKRAENLFLTGKDKPAIASIDTAKKQTTNPVERNTVSTAPKANKKDYANSIATQKKPIKSRRFNNLEGVQDGYYVVANVYKGGPYLYNFIDKLEEKGFKADYIDNQNNGLKYVYLDRFDSWEAASKAYKSNMNGSYDGDLWIMNVNNKYSNEAYASTIPVA